MQPKRMGIAALGLAAMVACGPVTLFPGEEGPQACGASGYQGLVGKNLAAVSLPADLNARIIGPDTAVTMDYSPTRMNIQVDEDSRIERIYCG